MVRTIGNDRERTSGVTRLQWKSVEEEVKKDSVAASGTKYLILH